MFALVYNVCVIVRAISTAIICDPMHDEVIWAYIAGPIIGSVLAACNAYLLMGRGSIMEHSIAITNRTDDAKQHIKAQMTSI